MSGWLLSIGAFILSGIGFLIGKSLAESERILVEKRRVYEDFLRECPLPNDAYLGEGDTELVERIAQMQRQTPVMMFYASPSVALACGRYLDALGSATRELGPESPPLHEAFKKLARAHNDLILEMRRDAFSWSAFAYRGSPRLPKDALEQAQRNSLQ